MEWPLWYEREMISSRIEWKIVCMYSMLNACLVNNKLKKVCSFVYVHMLKHSLVSLRLATEVKKKLTTAKRATKVNDILRQASRENPIAKNRSCGK